MSEVNPRVLVIPNHQDWEYQALEQLCVHIGRGTAPRYVEKSDVKAIGQRCVSKTGFDPSFARPHSERAMGGTLQAVRGDVLLNSTGTGTLGRSVVFRENGRFIVDAHVTALRTKEGKSSSVWLSAVLQSSWGQKHLERFCYAGSTNQVELSASTLRVSEVPTPPYNEQSKIAEVLDTLDEAIRGTEAMVAKLKAMKQGLLHDLLTRGIDANGDLRPPQPEAAHLYKQTPLGWLPREWDTRLLDEVAVRGSGHTPSKSIASYWNGGIKWVSLADSHRLDQVFIRETDKEISEAGLANSSAVRHPENTVILSRDAGIGKSAILASEMAVSQHFMAWRCGSKLNHVFLYYVLQREKPRFEAIAIGSTIKTIGLPFFKNYVITLPPKHEQDRSAEILLEIERHIVGHEQELQKLRATKSGLMDDLLTGKMPVTALL